MPALDASVAAARRRVVERLQEWHIDRQTCEDAQLLVSELFTNAVRHTASEKVSCVLWLSGLRLRMEVADQGGGAQPEEPGSERALDTDGESGRGLLLVSALAEDWGIRPESDSGTENNGHAVWAELPCTRTLENPAA
ncbi:ATP-binding protein [Streptomyces sp. HNM0574]|nr:ATP-binding protein [Streptomyces sp. HNM0574]NLU68728.1 ATP-binding protein [Streptomyces sp. HNM0574]